MSATATAVLVPRRRPRRAAAEPLTEPIDGAAFAALYDEHESRVYNLCYRITGSRDDAADATQETFLKVLERLPALAGRELNFGAYVLTSARHASYDVIARRRRATPAADIPDSAVPIGSGGGDPDGPERRALLEAHQEDIRAANASLPARQREALALRELEGLSYDEVAEIMGMNRNSVAQLISRARINLRDGLRRGALGSVAAASPQCEQALPMLAMRQDDALDDPADASWLLGHLSDCATCRVRVAAMEEAGAAYRLWLPLVPVLWLRGAAIAKAAERVGADWSAVASRPAGRRGRRLAAAAGGILVLVAAGLVAADRADAPLHLWAPSPLPPAPHARPAVAIAAALKPAPVRHRHRRHHRHHAAKPAPTHVVAAAPAAAAAVAAPPAKPVATVTPKAKPKPSTPARRHAATKPVDPVAPVVTPDPPDATIPDPPPPPPPGGGGGSTVPRCPGDPRCVPPPPPRPPVCGTCTVILPNPPPPSGRGPSPLVIRADRAAKVGSGQQR